MDEEEEEEEEYYSKRKCSLNGWRARALSLSLPMS
jgi:hypothetical protein